MRTLVVYFSRTGHTQQLAERIAKRLGAEVDVIVDREHRKGLLGYARCAVEAILERTPPIDPSRCDPARYDLVVIGTPIWFASMSSPVRSYLARHHAALRNVAFFCTCGGSGGSRVLAQLARATGRPARATLILREAQLARGDFATDVEAFARAVEGERPEPSAPAPTPAA